MREKPLVRPVWAVWESKLRVTGLAIFRSSGIYETGNDLKITSEGLPYRNKAYMGD